MSRNFGSPLLGFLLKRAQHAYRTRVDGALQHLGITAPQYAVLSAIKAESGISNAELARIAFVTPPTMQGILTNLERAGYLNRKPHPHHGKVLQSALTEQGLHVLEQAHDPVMEIEQLLTRAIGEAAVSDFADMLSNCAESLAAPKL